MTYDEKLKLISGGGNAPNNEFQDRLNLINGTTNRMVGRDPINKMPPARRDQAESARRAKMGTTKNMTPDTITEIKSPSIGDTMVDGLKIIKKGVDDTVNFGARRLADIDAGAKDFVGSLANAARTADQWVSDKISPQRVKDSGGYLFGNSLDAYIGNLEQERDRSIQSAEEGASNVEKVFGQGVRALPQMTAGMPLFVTSSMGQYARDAEKQGADINQRALHGVVGGAVEGSLESAFGVVPGLKNLKNITKGGFKGFVKNVAGEALEEAITDPLVKMSEKATFKKDLPWYSKTEDAIVNPSSMGQSALGGAAMATMLAPFGLSGNVRNNQQQKPVDPILKPQQATSIEPVLKQPQQAQQQAAATTFTVSTDNGPQSFNTADFKDEQGRTLDEAINDDPIAKELSENLKDTASKPDEFIKQIAPSIKDRSGFMSNLNTVYSVLERAFGNNYGYVKSKYLDELDSSKGGFAREVQNRTNAIYNDVVSKYGIKQGTKESAAIQWYGEGKRIQGADKGFINRLFNPQYDVVKDESGREIKVPKMEEYTLQDLKREFPDKWQDIVESEKVFRKQYDEVVDLVNESRRKTYPYVEQQIEDLKQRGNDIDREIINYKNNLKSYEQQLKVIDDSIIAKKAEMQGKKTNTMKYHDLQRQIDNLEARKVKFRQDKIDFTNRRISELAKQRNEITKQTTSDDLLRNKRLLKRKDYFRHFKEMNSGVMGLFNIIETPSQISSNLAGISEFTQPKSKFAGFMQQRGLGDYTADAVGGFLNYIKPAAHAIHIDPNITGFRQLAKDISDGTVKTKNANNLVKYLSDYANSLAGKTNKYDRLLQEDIPGGRTAFAILNWFNSRVKANAVLGNARSSFSQFANVPAGVSEIKDIAALTKGMGQTMAGFMGKGDGAIKKSDFMTERYLDDTFSKFDTKLINQPKKFAAWMLGFGDKVGTTFIWNSAYQQAVAKGDKNPIKAADDLTRYVVAGRGIGEVPIMQQSKLFQTFFPFQLEVGNLVHVVGKRVKEKDVAGLILLAIGNYIFNSITESIFGDGVLPDPIGAMEDAIFEGNDNLLQKGYKAVVKGESPKLRETNPLEIAGRLAGEGLSNMPMGQTIASAWPEYPTEIKSPIGGFTIPSRKQLFGDGDPTRFGGGALPVKALQDPFYKIAMPWGGGQLKKTVEGIDSLAKGRVEKKGELQYLMPPTLPNLIKAPLFGKYSTSEARNYFDNNLRPLSVKQSQAVYNSDDPQAQFEQLHRRRAIDRLSEQIKDVAKDDTLSDTEKEQKIQKLRERIIDLRDAQ